MEIAITKAKALLYELVAAAQNGERVVITKHGEPAVELVGCPKQRTGSIDWEKWDKDCRRLGFRDIPADQVEATMAALNDSALSRRVLGLEDEQLASKADPGGRASPSGASPSSAGSWSPLCRPRVRPMHR